jgi:hypothetical protein
MSRRHQSVVFVAAALAVAVVHAQNLRLPPANVFPPQMRMLSPVDQFRDLLAMTARQRATALTNRPPEVRARILAKVREYQALGPDERELRLRATELRWYLTPLLRQPPAEREAQLALVPEALRGLVQTRLEQWNVLPPPLQQEFLANDRALHYFAHVEPTNSPTPETSRISEQFNQFFELTPTEKQATLKTLSDSERAQMEQTLQTFEKLPPSQRRQCVQNYARFAGMSPPARAEFLKNAGQWSKMSPQERQSWRDLVANVPVWPPLPTAVMPMAPENIMPPLPPKIPRASVVTNSN